jgi:serine/threonine protein kinase
LNGKSQSVFEAKWISEEEEPPVVIIKRNEEPSEHEKLIYSTFKKHPNIIHTYGFVEDNDGSVMILQERAPHGNLQHLLESGQFQPSPTVMVKIFLQIIDAMIAIVKIGLIHGDLRCENILVFEMDPTHPEGNSVKLANFILAHPNDSSYTDNRRLYVPIRYCAPEILRSAGRSNYSESSDAYSMGVLMWQAYSQGKQPYDSSKTNAEVRQRKLNGEELPRPHHCDDQIWLFISECWLNNPELRYDFKGMKILLS